MKTLSIKFAALFILLGSLTGSPAAEIRLTETTTVVFASVEAGQAALQIVHWFISFRIRRSPAATFWRAAASVVAIRSPMAR